jgi:hypothetical protein
MPIVLLTEAGYVLRTNISRITREQEGRRGYLQRGLLVEADSVLSQLWPWVKPLVITQTFTVAGALFGRYATKKTLISRKSLGNEEVKPLVPAARPTALESFPNSVSNRKAVQ